MGIYLKVDNMVLDASNRLGNATIIGDYAITDLYVTSQQIADNKYLFQYVKVPANSNKKFELHLFDSNGIFAIPVLNVATIPGVCTFNIKTGVLDVTRGCTYQNISIKAYSIEDNFYSPSMDLTLTDAYNFTDLSYITLNAGSYIDLGIKPSTGYEISVDLMFNSITATYGNLLGESNRLTTPNTGFIISANSEGLHVWYGGTANNPVANPISTATKYNITIVQNVLYINSVAKMILIRQVWTSAYNMFLGMINLDGTATSEYANNFNFYGMKLWNASGLLVLDIIPVLKDNIPCVYDKVNRNYLYNATKSTHTNADFPYSV